MRTEQTIQLGIDLWTTNSSIVINQWGKLEIIKNSEGMEHTPSVFWYNQNWTIQIGKRAYENLFRFANSENTKNYKAEIKRLMGMREKVYFERVNQSLSAEEISAEILKYLKGSALIKHPNINTDGVVITVPAYFNTTQNEATKAAGELAGFKHVVLIQEPIAAALAYGFDNQKNENWLIYDLWGGTFDVAVVSSQDGILTVLWHTGDNYLGGKDFDNLIINNIILPALNKKYHFNKVSVENNKVVYHKLKDFAEWAKRELSFSETTIITIENLQDDNNKEVFLEIEFSKEKFEHLIKADIDRTIEFCKKAITDSWLNNSDIDKVVLVGGSTQIPYVQQRIQEDLGIQVDKSADPFTVVAKWAGLYGASQIIPKDTSDSSETKSYSATLTLEYDPVVAETETIISWTVKWIDLNQKLFIQIQSEDGLYSSNREEVAKDGSFLIEEVLVSKKNNIYYIYLTDQESNVITTNIEQISIQHGLVIAGTPLSHSVWVAINSNTFSIGEQDIFERIFERNMILPLNKKGTFYTSRDLKVDDTTNVLPIKILEWESDDPDRNHLICEVILQSKDIPYDLAKGTEVELDMDIDVSGTLSLSVYIPEIEFFKKLEREVWRTRGNQNISYAEVLSTLKDQKYILKEIGVCLDYSTIVDLEGKLDALESQLIFSHEEDNKRRIHAQLQPLVDEIAKLRSIHIDNARSIVKYKESVEDAGNIVETGDQERRLQSYVDKGDTAIKNKLRDSLRNITNEIIDFTNQVYFNSYNHLKRHLEDMFYNQWRYTDPYLSKKIIEEAKVHISNRDIAGMRQSIRDLRELLPKRSSFNTTSRTTSSTNQPIRSWITR